jgi:von Willebrand factor A domain-containing protein 3
VTALSIQEAMNWLNEWHFVSHDRSLNSNRNISNSTFTCEACTRAFEDDSLEAVYLLSEGVSSSSGARELLYDRMVKMTAEKRVPLNVVSFNCEQLDTVEYLRRLAESSHGLGRFHAYCLLRDVEDYEPGPVNATIERWHGRDEAIIGQSSSVLVNRKFIGGAPPGATGVRDELMLVFNELLESKEIVARLKAIVDEMMTSSTSVKRTTDSTTVDGLIKLKQIEPIQLANEKKYYDEYDNLKDEESMSSVEWLAKNGLEARKLELFDVLSQVCFRHCDGVVDIKRAPSFSSFNNKLVRYIRDGIEYFQGDAVSSLFLFSYCFTVCASFHSIFITKKKKKIIFLFR